MLDRYLSAVPPNLQARGSSEGLLVTLSLLFAAQDALVTE